MGLFGKEDVEHPLLSVEVKSRMKFIGRGWLEQAKRNAPAGKQPVVVVHEKHKDHKNDMVLMDMDFFKALVKGVFGG